MKGVTWKYRRLKKSEDEEKEKKKPESKKIFIESLQFNPNFPPNSFESPMLRGHYLYWQGTKSFKENPLIKLMNGPLNKEKHTLLFEQIIKGLLLDDLQIERKPTNEYFVTLDQTLINLNQLISSGLVNFSQLEFDEAICHRAFLMANKPRSEFERCFSPYLPTVTFERLPEEEDYRKLCPELENLSVGELACINLYTGEWYKFINSIFRGNFDFINRFEPEKSVERLKESLVFAAIAAFGLAKPVCFREDHICFREELNLPEDILEHYISITQSGLTPLVDVSTFLSTSLYGPDFCKTYRHYGNDTMANEIAPVNFIIERPMLGKNISAISQRKEEREFLIPPSMQLLLLNYEKLEWGSASSKKNSDKDKVRYVFYARIGNSPKEYLDLDQETLQAQPSQKEKKKIEF